MPNYKVHIDLCDVYNDLILYDLRDFHHPFVLLFVDANDPDDACENSIYRIQSSIMKIDPSLEARVLCRKVRKLVRIDKIKCP